jgi:hypothetical protein
VSIRFKQTKIGPQGEVYIIKQSQAERGLADHYPSPGSVKGSGEDIITVITRGELSDSHGMIAPAPCCSQVITGHCPHL